MSEIRRYTVIRQRGVDDLQSIYAFVGNSQGDESRSNEISDYVASKGWMNFIFDGIEMNQEAIYEESNRRNRENIEYIKKLKKEDRYKEEYELSIDIMHNPIFDDKQVLIPIPLEYYKITFLDFNKDEQ